MKPVDVSIGIGISLLVLIMAGIVSEIVVAVQGANAEGSVWCLLSGAC